MQKLEFEIDKPVEVIKAIIDKLPFLSRFDVEKILANKDVKINGQRINNNINLFNKDKVTVFYNSKKEEEWYSVVYVDDNILIVNKRAKIEVVSENDRDLISILKKSYSNIKAVHRLDRNTEGLVIFALNNVAEKELTLAFKTRNGIIKKYALMAHGRVNVENIKRTVYLKKLEHLSKVWISELKTTGYEPIITEFKLIKYVDKNTLLEANLITGKTHQIRAHIAYYGYPILGEQKYGKDDYKQLHLTANYLEFNFVRGSSLAYLNKKNFEIIPTWL